MGYPPDPMMPTRPLILLALILSFPQLSGAQDKDKYPIKLHRPAVEGEAYTYAAVGRLMEKIDVTVDGQTTQTKHAAYRCELASRVDILKVDDKGLPTEMLIKVYRFQKQAEDEELALDLLGRGSEIHCKFTADGDTFTVGDKPVSEEIEEALGIVAMRLSSQSGETEDEIMGTGEPKSEGDTWAISSDSIATALARNGFHIAPEKLRTEARLTSATKPEGAQPKFLGIDVTIIGEGISPELPAGYQLKSGTLTNKISRRLPTDPKLPCAGEEVEFEIAAEAEGKEADATINLKIHLKQSLKARYNRTNR